MTAPKPPSPPPSEQPPGRPDAAEPIDDSLLDNLPSAEFEALRWSVRMSDGLSPTSRAEFNAWLNADHAHRAAYEDIVGVWDAIERIPAEGHASIRASVAIDSVARSAALGKADAVPAPRMAKEPPVAVRPLRPDRRSVGQALAGIIALGLVGGGGWLGWNHWQNKPVFREHYAVQRGHQRSVQLPDGSSLQLDTATQVDVAFYRHRREVRVPEGQLYLQVQADAQRPFDILVGAARITVVGTQFSVRYTPSIGIQAVQVAVSEGRVRVASNGGAAELAEAIVLSAGQALAVDAQGKLGAVTTVAAASIAPWRRQRLSFDGVPLGQVLAEIGRYGEIAVHVQEPAVASLPVTVSVDLGKLSTFVQTLPRVLPVQLVRSGDGLEIVSRKR